MKLRLVLLIFLGTSYNLSLYGQDIHWSQFFNNPLYNSPSEAGNIEADYRFVANYRNQWRSVTIPFTTFSVSGDTRLLNKPKIGLGAQFMNDQVGDGKLMTNELIFSSSYDLGEISEKWSFRPGVQLGFQTRSLNPSAFSFDKQYMLGSFEPTAPTGESIINNKTVAFTSGIGLSSDYVFNKTNETRLTLGLFNLNKPNQGFYGQKIPRDQRLNLFVEHTYKFSSDIHILPALQINSQGKYREVILGSQVKYFVLNRMGQYRAAIAGLWFRAKDSFYLNFGYDYQNWRMGVSYDFNVSQLVPASNVRGGIEFSVRYLLFTIKAKKINHRVCPDYI